MAEQNHTPELDLRRGGRWNRGKMEGCYLSALPRQLTRAVAGWSISGGTYFLARNLKVPQDLRQRVFPWLESQKEKHAKGDNDVAGTYFIRLMEHLRDVLVQYCALLHRTFRQHPIFFHEIFSTDAFRTFSEQVEKASISDNTPAHLLVQRAMAHLLERMDAGFAASRGRDSEIRTTISQLSTEIAQQFADLSCHIAEEHKLLASVFQNMTIKLEFGGTCTTVPTAPLVGNAV